MLPVCVRGTRKMLFGTIIAYTVYWYHSHFTKEIPSIQFSFINSIHPSGDEFELQVDGPFGGLSSSRFFISVWLLSVDCVCMYVWWWNTLLSAVVPGQKVRQEESSLNIHLQRREYCTSIHSLGSSFIPEFPKVKASFSSSFLSTSDTDIKLNFGT
jgi:hypothetical protein